jgi:hypothetical protein
LKPQGAADIALAFTIFGRVSVIFSWMDQRLKDGKAITCAYKRSPGAASSMCEA